MPSSSDLPTRILRVEGAVILGLAVFLYTRGDRGWLLFLLLLLAPDLSMVGYAAGRERAPGPTTPSTRPSGRPRWRSSGSWPRRR